jgi:alanine racemase
MDAPTKRPRIADVAREAGVSKTAVSFAFNSPERLNAATAERIRMTADALGYRPHPVARMLGQRRTFAIGILTPHALSSSFSNPFFGMFAEGVALATEASGYSLHFISPLRGSLGRAIGQASVDGFIAVGLSSRHPEVETILRAGLPMVLVDSSSIDRRPAIEVDDRGGARAAAEHLLALGHRAILVMAVEPAVDATRDDPDTVVNRRMAGYRDALGAAGVELRPEDIVAGAASIEGGQAAFRRAWEGGLRPTAVLAMSDAMAIGAMRAARDLGSRVPADLSVVGFDDVDLATQTDPPLTTVHQPIRRKGRDAARLLLSLVDEGRPDAPSSRRLETRLVVRASTAAPGRRPSDGPG